MKTITTTAELAEACTHFADHPYVTVDTEFLRETTYWPKLCLIQMAGPDDAVLIDPLAEGLDLAPFFALMADTSIVKVFHAGRQDIEIIYHLGNLIPAPMFDSQVAAMVCGFGDSISYDQLVMRLTGARLDKSHRYTDWSRRPLTEKQLTYALADVTHLRDVYHALRANLEEQKRSEWVQEEMEILTSPETYYTEPSRAWKRMKLRIRKPKEFAALKELAAWRESEAQARDVPRNRVLKDEAIFELAIQQPQTQEALSALRSTSKGYERSKSGHDLLQVMQKVAKIPVEDLPDVPKGKTQPEGSGAAVDLMKVLLKLTSERHGVAAKVIATVDDLEKIACDDDADVAALKGWRRELFGQYAIKVKTGEMALRLEGKRVATIECEAPEIPEKKQAAKRRKKPRVSQNGTSQG
ncbi:ribonuclease D [Cohaesibacter celericrescens]|uniref:Ribonuclease D n=1 Tax=Cohaesibacter celericrescens TaxID=2067669 RepID=A0A2N5XSM3_9HYPH|nr:ribonuclease D [Cohaesibacter celericrescens]PLW77418.1 ribonuclease D [Cohaesibacter celericrescens]